MDFEQGLTARGLEGFRTAARLAPSSRTHQALADALSRSKRYEEAAAELRAAARFEGLEGQQALEKRIAALERVREDEVQRARPPEPEREGR